MGCFNVACVMSGISMYGDRAGLMILEPNIHKPEDNHLPTGANIVSNHGVHSLYNAVSFPIFGRYDTYGKLDDIYQDEHTRALERYFKMPIAELVELVAYGEEVPGYPGLAGTFVSAEVYEIFSTSVQDEQGRDGYHLWEAGDLEVRVLNIMGFEHVKTDTSKERYQYLYKHPSFPKVDVWSDGTWVEVMVGKKKYPYICRPKDFVEFLHGQGKRRLPEKTIRQLKRIPIYQIRLEKELKTLHNFRRSSLTKNMKRAGLDPDEISVISCRYFRNSRTMLKVYGEPLLDSKLDDHMIRLWAFLDNMFYANKLLMPTFNGSQHGNHYTTRHLAEITGRIATKKIQGK